MVKLGPGVLQRCMSSNWRGLQAWQNSQRTPPLPRLTRNYCAISLSSRQSLIAWMHCLRTQAARLFFLSSLIAAQSACFDCTPASGAEHHKTVLEAVQAQHVLSAYLGMPGGLQAHLARWPINVHVVLQEQSMVSGLHCELGVLTASR